jgi:hypothetical protein
LAKAMSTICEDKTIRLADPVCGLCGSTRLTDLGHGENGTVICKSCDAHWWQRWYTREEWETWINGTKESQSKENPNELASAD